MTFVALLNQPSSFGCFLNFKQGTIGVSISCLLCVHNIMHKLYFCMNHFIYFDASIRFCDGIISSCVLVLKKEKLILRFLFTECEIPFEKCQKIEINFLNGCCLDKSRKTKDRKSLSIREHQSFFL